jgi:excisionase family DNA binding protein
LQTLRGRGGPATPGPREPGRAEPGDRLLDVRGEAATLFADPARAAEVPTEALPALLGELERMKATLWVRLWARPSLTPKQATVTDDSEHLIAAPEVAQVLGVPVGSVRDLMRRGVLPTVRVGRKYVRVRGADLRAYILQHRDAGVDHELYTAYSAHHDGRRTPTPPATPSPVDAKATRRTYGHHQHDGRSVGARRAADLGTRRSLRASNRRDRGTEHGPQEVT